METVKMSHPDLPGQDIEVSTLAVPIHRQSGWRTADEDPKDTSKTTPAAATGPAKGKE